jgi:hypothetical protein
MSKGAFEKLSNIKCFGCGDRLKQNLIDKKPDARWCFECYSKDFIATRPGYHGKGRQDERAHPSK